MVPSVLFVTTNFGLAAWNATPSGSEFIITCCTSCPPRFRIVNAVKWRTVRNEQILASGIEIHAVDELGVGVW